MDRLEWLLWRTQGVGGSDAPVIMGVSQHQTMYELWLEKTRQVPLDRAQTFITRKGNQYEPFARAKYELINDMEMPPLRYQHKKFNFLLATLDGGNVENQKGIEIKYTGKDAHHAAKIHKIIPVPYWIQIQHQLMVTGYKSIDYLSYYVKSGKNPDGSKIKPDPKKGDLVVIEVFPDKKWIVEKYLPEVGYFWNCVKTNMPPKLSKNDTTVIKKNDDLALAYIEAQKILDKATTDCAKLKKELENIAAGMVRVEFGKTGLVLVKTQDSYKAILTTKNSA